MEFAASVQVLLSATTRLESEGVSPSEADISFPQAISEARRDYRCPVALLLPGISPATASRRVARQLAKQQPSTSLDANTEHSALEFLAAHRAAARQGIAVTASSVSDRAYKLLDALERTSSPKKIKEYLDKISREVVEGLTTEEQSALLHASSITSFSEFPIGLVTIPPDTSPPCCRTPIAYRPLFPLTRALQFETFAVPMIYLRDRLTILCLECIPEEDRVGRLSRHGWKMVAEQLRGRRSVIFDFVEVDSIVKMREALRARQYNVAVISAHGAYIRTANRTGIRVGHRDILLEEELEGIPPLVLLAACQVAPRGAGSVNITDLLFRQGAFAVLGTLVPIDVRRNANLMLRFFIYIAETLEGNYPLRSIDKVWQFTAASNAVLDVTWGARRVAKWMFNRWNGRHGLEEFMLNRSVGRLRSGHIYADTEAIMREMAMERGKGAAFNAWLSNQGYIPESIFYVFLGWPERFVVCDKEFELALSWSGLRTESSPPSS